MLVHIINEHPDWLAPLGRALEALGVAWREHFVNEGLIDLDAPPPAGVFFNRMSASSHTRGHFSSVRHTRPLLAYLEQHGCRVVNGSRAFELEMSKVRQHAALKAAGFDVPRTIAVIGGKDPLRDAARQMPGPFILKPNRGGKGLGVRLFQSTRALDEFLDSPEWDTSPDGVILVQEYVKAAEPYITRCEFVGGKFLYAIRSSTSEGFELCPADGCAPCGINAKFTLREGFDHPVLNRLADFGAAHGLEVFGAEFIEGDTGRLVVYDLNATTNYNPAVEQQAGVSGSAAVAQLLASALSWGGRGGGC